MFEYTVFCLFVVLCIVNVDSKVCSEQKVVNSVQIVSYVQTYTELSNAVCLKYTMDYEYNDYIETTYKCLKTATKSKLRTRYEPQTENKTVYFCCPGYSEIDSLNSNNTNEEDINCEPICDLPCLNGLCVEPQKCLCLPGYITSPDPSNPCVPVCDLDCGHGICIKPNTCKCFTGYELMNTGSHAVCTKTQHKEIECSSGYIKSVNGTCLPRCSNGCLNGICTSPEICKCNLGFHLTTVNFVGLEICTPDCNPGYKKIGGICLPECRHSCGNGTCILPNVCECFRGYKIDITKFSSQASNNGFLCIPLCKGVCAGECVAPNTCITSTTTALSSKTATGFWRTSIPITTTSFTTHSTTSRSTAYWLTTPRSTTSRSNLYWLTAPRTTTSSSTPYWSTSPRTTTSRSTPYWSTTPRTTTSRSTPYLWTTPRTTTSRTTPYWSTTPRTTTSRSTPYLWTTPRTTTSRTTPYWWTTPQTTTTPRSSWSTTPVLPSLPTTQQYTEMNSTKTATTNPSEGTNNGADKTWMEDYWASVLLPVLLLLFAILVMIIVWRRKPIIIYLTGRSYVVEDDVLNGYNIDQRVHYSKRKENVECK